MQCVIDQLRWKLEFPNETNLSEILPYQMNARPQWNERVWGP